MNTPSAATLLHLWENGLDQPLLHKSLNLLVAAFPESDWETVAQWPIGRRDLLLIQMRGRLFGTDLVNTARCPACSETVEWSMTTNELQLGLPENAAPFKLDKPPYKVQFRLPNSMDILHFSDAAPALQLVRDCILEAEKDGTACKSDDLPHDLLLEVDRCMENVDPQSNLSLALICPHCNHQWVSVFDILTYLWTEIDNWAKHLLQEVYMLARAFGWSEKDILNMGARRRQLYLEMLRT